MPASASHPPSSTLRSVCFPSAPEAGRFRWPGRGAGLHLPLPFCVHLRVGTCVCPVESFPAFMILREEAKEPDVRAHRASLLSAPRCWVPDGFRKAFRFRVHRGWACGLMRFGFVPQHSLFWFRMSPSPFLPSPPPSPISLCVQDGPSRFPERVWTSKHPCPPRTPAMARRLVKTLLASWAETLWPRTLHPVHALSPPPPTDMPLPVCTGPLQQLAPNNARSHLGLSEWPGSCGLSEPSRCQSRRVTLQR